MALRTNWTRKAAPYKRKMGVSPVQFSCDTAFSNYLSVLEDVDPMRTSFHLVEPLGDYDYSTYSNGMFEVDYDPVTSTAWTYQILREQSIEEGWSDAPQENTRQEQPAF